MDLAARTTPPAEKHLEGSGEKFHREAVVEEVRQVCANKEDKMRPVAS